MKEYAAQFYSSQAWKRCRQAYRKQARGLCERCLTKGIYRPGEIVHHIKHITPENIMDPAVTLNPDNLQLLCRDCHAEIHQQKTNRRYKLDELGRVVFC